MDINLIYENLLETQNESKENCFIKKVLSAEFCICINSKIQLGSSLTFFISKLDKLFMNGTSDRLKKKSMTYCIDNDRLLIDKLKDCFHLEFIIPTDDILGQLPTRGNVITKVSKCKQYILINWDDAGIFFAKVGNNYGFIYQLVENDTFESMLKYFIITPFVFLKELIAVHGGIINFRGKNCLITNLGNTGKTSFTLLFWSNGATVISEDMSYLNKNGDILCVPIRNYFNLRIGTLNAFRSYFKQQYFDMEISRSSEESIIDSSILFKKGRQGQIRININQICEKDKVTKIESNNKIDKVIIPDLCEEQRGFAVSDISSSKILEMIKSDIGYVTIEWFKYFIERTDENDDVFIYSIFEKVPSYQVKTDLNYISNFENIIEELKFK